MLSPDNYLTLPYTVLYNTVNTKAKSQADYWKNLFTEDGVHVSLHVHVFMSMCVFKCGSTHVHYHVLCLKH